MPFDNDRWRTPPIVAGPVFGQRPSGDRFPPTHQPEAPPSGFDEGFFGLLREAAPFLEKKVFNDLMEKAIARFLDAGKFAAKGVGKAFDVLTNPEDSGGYPSDREWRDLAELAEQRSRNKAINAGYELLWFIAWRLITGGDRPDVTKADP